MRLDLFLKTSRLVKRRAVAQEMCGAGRVLVNGLPAKPAREIRTGDAVRLSYSSRTIDVEVLMVPETAKNVKAPPEELYRITAEHRREKDDR